MATKIKLPDCLLEALRQLFPNLNFDEIEFYRGKPGIHNLFWTQRATTRSTTSGTVQVFIRASDYTPCSQETFLLIVNELVHAQQIQQSFLGGAGIGPFNTFRIQYLGCLVKHLFKYSSNSFEKESDEFENNVRKCIGKKSPCDCDSTFWIGVTPGFDDVLRKCGDSVIFERSQAQHKCFPSGFFGAILSFFIFVVGFIVSIIVSILEFIGDFIEVIIKFIGGLFGLGGPDRLNLMFSEDKATTFGYKTTVAETNEPPGIAFYGDELHVGWTSGNDIKLVKSPHRDSTNVGGVNEDSGPSLTGSDSELYLAFLHDSDSKCSIVLTLESLTPVNPLFIDIFSSSPKNASPSLAIHSGRLFLAWVASNTKQLVIQSRKLSDANWRWPAVINQTSVDHGTPALASDGQYLYLGWTGRDRKHKINILVLNPTATGEIIQIHHHILDQWTTDQSGPGLASDGTYLYLAFLSADGDHYPRVQKLRVRDSGTRLEHISTTILRKEKARANASPAIAYHPTGVLCLAWIGDE